MATKRTIYSYLTEVYSVDAAGNTAQLRWNHQVIVESLQSILRMSDRDRVLAQDGDWFFYLEELNVTNDYILGCFEGVKIGPITKLTRLSTMTTRPNPKNPDESETRRTYFYIRLRDGLLLLDNYKENVVTSTRLENYLETKAAEVFVHHRVRHIHFKNIVDYGFLERINNFEMINNLKLRLSVNSDRAYTNDNDGISTLQRLSQSTYANYVDIGIGRFNARKNGLLPQELNNFVSRLLEQKGDEVKVAVIEGKRNDGGPKKVSIRGIEEKFSESFDVDAEGEVLPTPIKEFMIEIGRNHRNLL